MALIAKQPDNTGNRIAPLSAGMHVATCYAVIDLGVQYSEIWDKEQHKILLIWETDEDMTTSDGEQKPKAISKEFVLSLHEKSDLYKTLISWRGKAFTPDELKGFDVSKVLGAPCLLNIVEVKKDDRTYSNIGSITPLMKGQQAPALFNKKVLFELNENTIGKIDDLPQWIADKIRKSVTYHELTDELTEKQDVLKVQANDEIDDEELPF